MNTIGFEFEDDLSAFYMQDRSEGIKVETEKRLCSYLDERCWIREGGRGSGGRGTNLRAM